MKLVHNIGTIKHENYNTREEIEACTDTLGFDGVYLNVYENRDVLQGKEGVFFVMGNYVGKDNAFDLPNVPRLEKFCTWEQIFEMARDYGFKVGWHTWSHPDLTQLSTAEIMKEVRPPVPMKFFAYPYGRYNQRVIECVRLAGYEAAWSVTQGTLDMRDPYYRFRMFRDYL